MSVISLKKIMIQRFQMFNVIGMLMCFFVFSAKALAFEKQIPHKDFTILLSSPKNFVSGKNEFELSIKQGEKFIKDSAIKLSFIMPEMPGMPKMTESAILSLQGNTYKGVVTFPHGGTWQIRIQFNIENKKYQAKSSIDF